MGSMEWAGSRNILGNSARLPLLTLSIGAQQFAWGVEQAYVSRYLRELGISKSDLAAVWVAGPLSGLVVQPVIGAISDHSTFKKGRRRPFMLASALVVAAALLVFGYAQDIGVAAQIAPLLVAISAVITMDIFINVCGATSRALIVDSLPQQEQQLANAWAGRMSATGHLASYFLCSVDMTWLLGAQIKSVCAVSAFLLVAGVGTTCAAVSERYLVTQSASSWSRIRKMVSSTVKASINLDPVLRSIFKVQLFGWYAWFGLIFFGADWAAETWGLGQSDPTPDEKARAGSMALLAFSISTTLCSLGLPVPGISTSTIWSYSYILYALIAWVAPWDRNYWAVLVSFTLFGIPWALTSWAPFALTAERIHELPAHFVQDLANDPENQVIMVNEDPIDHTDQVTENSGVYLGLHNTAISFPQIISAFGSWLVFRLIDGMGSQDNSYAVNIRVGGFFALIASIYALHINRIWESQYISLN